VYRCSSKLFSSCVLRKDEWSISYPIKAGYVHVRKVQFQNRHLKPQNSFYNYQSKALLAAYFTNRVLHGSLSIDYVENIP
jgi:hypothetical protein